MMRRWLLLLALLIALPGCALGPAPRTYVLTAPLDARASGSSEAMQPRVQLLPVTVPDYLDTQDLLTRSGANELKISATARWGERLSLGIGHALLQALSARLPHNLVTLDPATGAKDRQITVSIEAFDVWPDAHCKLEASWNVAQGNRATTIDQGRGIFTGTSVANADPDAGAAIVTAMASALDQLADRLAAAAASDAPQTPPPPDRAAVPRD